MEKLMSQMGKRMSNDFAREQTIKKKIEYGKDN